MTLDTTPLENALGELEENLQLLDAKAWGSDGPLKRAVERGAVQAFAYTYDSAMSLLRRRMELDALDPAKMRFLEIKDRFRTAADNGLIPDAVRFFDYRKKRDTTCRAYEDEVVSELLAILDPFRNDARFLLKELQDRR